VKTRLGDFSIIWKNDAMPMVNRILFPSSQDVLKREYPNATSSSTELSRKLAEDIAEFLDGEDVVFDLGIVDFDLCSEFQRRVILAEYEIPRGWVSTYGRIAKYLGILGSSRAVGRALATHPFPIIIPCHRAVRSDGGLGGYQGGVGMKKRLLEMEGVQFSPSGKVKMDRVYYDD
jgi:methylated-DNA-[protein]-cysteine S-methyltransferase